MMLKFRMMAGSVRPGRGACEGLNVNFQSAGQGIVQDPYELASSQEAPSSTELRARTSWSGKDHPVDHHFTPPRLGLHARTVPCRSTR